jgi:cytochrome b
MSTRILVWDIPTRIFHWLLAASFAGAFLTAESERYRDVHVALGYLLLALIGFRVVWGLVGTRYARFRSFAFGP